MKVVSPKTMQHLESLAYKDGYSEAAFMEEAAKGIAEAVEAFIKKWGLQKKVFLVCGKGNNGGDAYTAGVHLLSKGYDVAAYQIIPLEQCSPLCQQSHKRFRKAGGHIISSESGATLQFSNASLIVDGIFGTGFHGPVDEPYVTVIQAINQSHLPVIAIDIPSGLDGGTGIINNIAVKATETVFLGLPKTGYFFKEGWNVVGRLRFADFGLPASYVDKVSSELSLITSTMATSWMPSIQRNRHKYQAGHVVGLAGSPDFPGAAILSSFAALRGGAGIVHLLLPQEMRGEHVNTHPELIKILYDSKQPQSIIDRINKSDAVFIGPGIGRSSTTIQLLKTILPLIDRPCVIDADALTLLAEEDFILPQNTILTPHTGEMQRLFKDPSKVILDDVYLKRCQSFAEEKGVTLVLKGGPSFIFHPKTPVLVNATGNPGMATAGSGDVLTGLIAALLAQGLQCREAAALGVYLHGFAGDVAAKEKSEYCLIASDIIDAFPAAFQAHSSITSN